MSGRNLGRRKRIDGLDYRSGATMPVRERQPRHIPVH